MAETAKRGLDPNVWERGYVARKIGQETVTYVSNIYKCYISYRLILKSQAAGKEAVKSQRVAPNSFGRDTSPRYPHAV
jgi:hypothetical protein